METTVPITGSFEVSTRIGEAVAKESSRYALKHVQVLPCVGHRDDVFLAATDGHMAVVTRERGHINQPVFMPVEMAKPTKKGDKVSVNGLWRNSRGKMADLVDQDTKFPPLYDCLPDIAEYDTHISLNADLLVRLARAICADGVVTIHVKRKDDGSSVKPFIVTSVNVNGNGSKLGVGILMPCKADRSDNVYKAIKQDYTDAAKAALAI